MTAKHIDGTVWIKETVMHLFCVHYQLCIGESFWLSYYRDPTPKERLEEFVNAEMANKSFPFCTAFYIIFDKYCEIFEADKKTMQQDEGEAAA